MYLIRQNYFGIKLASLYNVFVPYIYFLLWQLVIARKISMSIRSLEARDSIVSHALSKMERINGI